MSKDLKIGMIIGVFLLIGATLMISFRSGGSLTDRLKAKFGKETVLTPDDNDTGPVASATKNNDAKPEKITNIEPTKNTDVEPEKDIDVKTVKNSETIHIVEEGQTIYDIAEKYYGNKWMINKIIDENRDIPDGFKLKAGMKIKIPK